MNEAQQQRRVSEAAAPASPPLPAALFGPAGSEGSARPPTLPPLKLAIIMPALDEAACLADTLRRLPPGLATQVIVVDNGSADATAAVARDCGATVVSEPRRGYGRACLAGLAQVRADIELVAILDADGADDAARLPAMARRIATGAADFVLSARTLGDARRHLTPPQRFGNGLACWLMWWATGHRYRDCGPMRVIRRDALAGLRMRDPTWGWNVEMQMKAVWHGLRIEEPPVAYHARTAGRSKISGSPVGAVRAGVKIISAIAWLWWRGRRPRVSKAEPCAPLHQPNI